MALDRNHLTTNRTRLSMRLPLVFFCFDFPSDLHRARRIRGWYLMKKGRALDLMDSARWRRLQGKAPRAIERWAEAQAHQSQVTVVLIGARSQNSALVKYGIIKSHQLEKGLLGLTLSGVKDSSGNKAQAGGNPLEALYVYRRNRKITLATLYPTYDWIQDGGHFNFSRWVCAALAEDPAEAGGPVF